MDHIFSPFFTEEDVVRLLKIQIAAFDDNQAAFARTFNLSPAYVNDLVTGRRKPGKKILDALNLEKVVYYVHKEVI